MKNTYLVRTFIALVLAGVLSACVGEQYDLQGPFASGEGLALNATVSEGAVVTRATESDVALKEAYLHTLDVFVEHVTNGTGDGTFIRQYHLSTEDAAGIPKLVDNFLASKWRTEGLVMGQYYNIYVATNNTQTKGTKDLATFNVAALKALVADEVTDGVAVVNEDNNNVTWGETSTSGNIYKLYDENPGSYRALTSEKEFMMDGVIKNWTPDPSTSDQVFKEGTESMLLNRAAAKFVLNVKFDADFLKSLTHNKKVEGSTTTWVEKPDAEKVTIVGDPAWKFYNFAFGAPVFAPETQGAGVQVHNSDFNIFHNQSFTGDDKHFQIVTYSYPNKWDAANYATAAPSLVISVGYKTGTVTNYHYYRIPLVKSTVTAIERNHIYVINATIATRGSSATEDQDLTEDIQYAVLPWNDQTNSAAVHGEVQSVQHFYFNANPKVYTLRGDGDQSVVINYSKASGTKVNWKLFTYDADGNQTGVVAKDAAGATRAWFYNANGVFTTTYNDTEAGVNWSNTGSTPMGVKIEQSTEGTSGSKGTVTVTSHALNNRAIKYIRLRVYLDEPETFQDGKETMYEDIIIRHFPTDNIQNIVGSWSSYVPSSGGTQTVTLTTRSLSEAQAWAQQYGVDYTTQEMTGTEYISYNEYTAHSSEDGYSIIGPTTSNRNAFLTAIQTNANRQAANSQANAVADAGEGNTYYWGTGVRTVVTNVRWSEYWDYYYDYDYYTAGTQNNRYNLYIYSNYYTVSYAHTYSYTQYSLTVEMTSTGNWVDWDRDAGVTYNQANVKYNRASIFTAKVFNEGDSRIYAIEPVRSGTYNNYSYTYRMATSQYGNGYNTYTEGGNYGQDGGNMTNLTNNHMYVIQISSTSEGYIMGRPILGNPNQYLSQDDVVSPAFMIASQLGAVSTTNSNTTAAEHCRRYMEVAADGTRYTGWRLPTPDEISVITRYQQGTINGVTINNANYQAMTPVLTGRYYWSLTGESVETSPQYSDGPYLRCVRDLSAAEVEALNGFDLIVEKYRDSGN